MKDRSKLAELYPKAIKKKYSISNETAIISLKIIMESAISIAILLTLPVATFMLMINYFIQIINVFNIINLLPVIIISLIAWVGLLVAVLKGVLNKLDNIAVAYISFLIEYGLSVLPVAQLTSNLYRHFNNGYVDVLPFIGFLFIENLIFVPSILLLINNKKISSKSKVAWLIGLVIFCAIITYVNSIY